MENTKNRSSNDAIQFSVIITRTVRTVCFFTRCKELAKFEFERETICLVLMVYQTLLLLCLKFPAIRAVVDNIDLWSIGMNVIWRTECFGSVLYDTGR